MGIEDGPVIVGGGPSGLAAAIELRKLGIEPVTVIEREREGGGIPRHSDHTGFGLRDLRAVLTGPRYSERYRELAADHGVAPVTETMVTGWEGRRGLKGVARTKADWSGGTRRDAAAGGAARHGLPRAAALGPAGAGFPACRGDDHLHAPAARPPPRAEGRAPRGDRRSRARELLGG